MLQINEIFVPVSPDLFRYLDLFKHLLGLFFVVVILVVFLGMVSKFRL